MTPIPYSRQEINEEDLAAVRAVLTSPFLTQGPAVPAFEAALASRHQADHAVAVCNATAALHIACLALELGPGDRLWTSPNSFAASANCGRYCGATVDFVDIDPATRNMSTAALAEKLQQAAVAGVLPKVVVPVDFAGLPCDLAEIRTLADRYGFRILADSSHAVGAEYRGRPVGSEFADIMVFSFHPVKIVTTGEGGACLTNDVSLAERLRLLRSHGITRDPALMESMTEGDWYYEQVSLGYNYRMTDIQAALGTSQMARLDEQHARRETLARRYDDLLSGLPLRLPIRLADRVSAHHLYVIELDTGRIDRRTIFDGLRAQGIQANVHYRPIHLQPDYARLGFAIGDFPAAEAYYARAITIPLFPALSHHEQDRVVAALTAMLE